ncbi:enhancer of ag-4 protein 2 [Quercus suber]|uniref:Enhancer of ag-4 protein 2 n=1 Tax=Quercus suber TaxID=58331 RepID=A0AAW0JEA7_QUESU
MVSNALDKKPIHHNVWKGHMQHALHCQFIEIHAYFKDNPSSFLSLLLTFTFGYFSSIHRGFVAPADIQAFTNELKSKLSARCQGKTVRLFSQAVNEICVAFDELQNKKSSGFRDGADKSDVGREALSVNEVEVDLKVETGKATYSGEALNESLSDSGSKLGRCSQRQGGTDIQDVNPSISCSANDSLSPGISPEKNNSKSGGGNRKEHVLMTSSPDNSFFPKEEASDDEFVEDAVCTKSNMVRNRKH